MNAGKYIQLLIWTAAVAIPILSSIAPNLLSKDVVLGIDLGTTYSVAAVCSAGNITVIPIDDAQTMPSIVHYPEGNGSAVVGSRAVGLRDVAPQRTVYDAKRLIGRYYDDPIVREEVASLLYPVAQDATTGQPTIPMGDVHVTPEGVATVILQRLKAEAEAQQGTVQKWLGHKFSSATISVPVQFDASQMSATRRAAEKAGFKQVRLLQEPIAAAIAYNVKPHQTTRTVLVYDFGGGTLDVAVLQSAPGQGFMILTTAGDPHLGGEDFDTALAAHYAAKLDEELRMSDAERERLAPWLKHSVELAKRQLSSASAAVLNLSEISQLPDASSKPLDAGTLAKAHAVLTRPETALTEERLEEVCAGLLQRALLPVKEVLELLELEAADINDVVLVGGSSRLRAVQRKVQQLFPGKPLNHEVDPDLAIAVGAARFYGC